MKKAVLLVAMLLGFIATTETKAQGFYLGLKGGLNLTSVSNRVNAETKLGANFGAMAGYQISPNVAVQAEALYSFQGYSNAMMDGLLTSTNMNLDYLKIPVLAKIYLIDGFNAEVGLSFNFLTSSLLGTEPYRGNNGFDLSIPIGVAYALGRDLEIGLRYDISLVDVSPIQNGTNGALSLNLAWRLW